jgi:hypothetical protein
VLAVPGHLRRPVLNREELPREAALLDHDLSVRDLLGLCEGRDLRQLVVGGLREERYPLQLG